VPEDFQGLRIVALGAQIGEQRGHHLYIVVDHVGSGGDHFLKILFMTLKIGDEDLDTDSRKRRPQGRNSVGKDCGAAVGKVVPGDGGEDGVLQVQIFYGRHKARNLSGIDRAGDSVFDVAIAAIAGADVAH